MNLLPIIKSLKIVTKERGLTRLGDVMNYAQEEIILTVERQFESGKPVRIIVLKARQIGVSTVTEAILFILAMISDYLNVMIISHDLDSAEHLLGITTNYWEGFDFNGLYTPQFKSQKRLGWRETNSKLQITTANNVDTGRSKTIHALHASEVAFWDDPETLMLGLRQSIPNTSNSIVILESTANGVGNFFEKTWNESVDGTNEYIPLFFPWHRHPEYQLDVGDFGLPPLDDPDLQEEERLLREMGIGDNRLAWRRWAITNLCGGDINKFHQEYPATPEEAFISSGRNVFSLTALRRCYQPLSGIKGRLSREGSGRVRFQRDPQGSFKMFKFPSDDTDYGIYMVGGDPTRTTKGDPACAQVINRRTWEQVAVWRGKIDPNSFANILAEIGAYYNKAMLIPEIEGPGYATIGALLQMDYPYIWKNQWADKAPGKVADTFGWSTTHRRKQWAIGNLVRAVVDNDITIHDSETFVEMRNYVTYSSGEMGPANEKEGHDDTVMALAIGLTGIITEAANVPPYGENSGPKVVEELRTMLTSVQADSPAGGGEQMAPWEMWGD